MTDLGALPLWPDTVEAFYADRSCSIRSERTRKSWGYAYRRLQLLHPGKPVGGFRLDDLVAFVTQRGWDGSKWAANTARNYRTALCSLFDWAHEAGRIPADPSRRLGRVVRIRRVKVSHPDWLTEPQIAMLLRSAGGDDLASRRARLLLMLGLFAGLRTGELRAVQWRDIDAGEHRIAIVGKGDKPATVTIPPQLAAELKGWRHTYSEAVAFAAGDLLVLPVLAFPGGDRTADAVVRRPIRPLGLEGIRKVVNHHGNQIGIDYLRPHDLRRTLAGTLAARPIQDIRVVLRHEQVASTQTYLADTPLRAGTHMERFVVDL